MTAAARSREPGGWFAVVLRVPESMTSEISGMLGPVCLGLEERQAGRRSELRAYVADAEAAERCRSAADEALRALALDPTDARLEIEPLADGRWAEVYQESLVPFPLGQRFLVVPGERAAQSAAQIPLRLVPGRAFGTGEHPTTRLAVAALERQVSDGTAWLDLGCGSAILALVVAHLGAARVDAIDNDAEAIDVASEIVAVNALRDVVRLRHGSLADAPSIPYAGVVANISRGFLLEHVEPLAASVVPAGTLITTGFLAEERAEVEAAFTRDGLFETVRVEVDGEWACLELRRTAR